MGCCFWYCVGYGVVLWGGVVVLVVCVDCGDVCFCCVLVVCEWYVFGNFG